MTFGYTDGDVCGRGFPTCKGVIEPAPTTRDCSCHVSPPCSACTDREFYCPVCGYESANDHVFNDYVTNVDPKSGVYKCWELRPLDRTKLDWHSHEHTNSSMIKRGVYPPGMTAEQVRTQIDGTFGGRFTRFENGEFEFVAYTD